MSLDMPTARSTLLSISQPVVAEFHSSSLGGDIWVSDGLHACNDSVTLTLDESKFYTIGGPR